MWIEPIRPRQCGPSVYNGGYQVVQRDPSKKSPVEGVSASVEEVDLNICIEEKESDDPSWQAEASRLQESKTL